MKLLITDDNTRMRTMLRSIFTPVFDEILECSNGKDSIALYGTNKPEWVFMDVKMKGMNGIEATKAIIQNDPAAKIIVVSQYNDVGIKQAAIDAGAVAFIEKINLHEIENIIDNYESQQKNKTKLKMIIHAHNVQ